MKIAIIQTSLIEPTGGERQALMLAINLQEMGHQVTIFTQTLGKNCFPELQKKISIVTAENSLSRAEQSIVSRRWNIPILYFFRYFKNLFQIRLFYRSIKKSLGDFDIINPHNFPMEWITYFVKRDFPNKKIIWMCNEPPFFYFTKQNLLMRFLNWPIFKFFDQNTVKMIDRIIVLDHLNQERVKNIYSRSAVIVRSGVGTVVLKTSSQELKECRRKLGLPEDGFFVLSVATLAPYKRPDKTLLAIHNLKKTIPSIKGIFIGSGEMESTLKKMTESMHLSDSIFFIKHVSEADLSKIYDFCDVFVFPANQTWGLSAVEAMLHALPVLVAKDCGVSEIIEDKKNAFLIDGNRYEDITEKILYIHNNSVLTKGIGDQAKMYVQENLSWKNYAKKMVAEFEK